MVASLVTSSRSRRRRSVTSRSSTSAPMCSPVGRSGIERRISVAAPLPISVSRGIRPPRTALRVSSSGRIAGRHQLAGHLGERLAGEVAGQPELAVDRQRVGAGVGRPGRPRRSGRSRRRPAGSRRGRSAGREREEPVRDHLGQARWRSGGRTARAGSAYARRAGWCCGRPPRGSGRRGGPGSPPPAPARRRATRGRPRGRPGPRSSAESSSGRRPSGTKVPTRSSTSAVGPVVGPHLRAGPVTRCRRGPAARAPGRRTTGRR